MGPGSQIVIGATASVVFLLGVWGSAAILAGYPDRLLVASSPYGQFWSCAAREMNAPMGEFWDIYVTVAKDLVKDPMYEPDPYEASRLQLAAVESIDGLDLCVKAHLLNREGK